MNRRDFHNSLMVSLYVEGALVLALLVAALAIWGR